MDSILSTALCSQFVVGRTPGASLTNLKDPVKLCRDDISANEPLLTELIKYSLTTPMHPAAIRKGIIDLDLRMQSSLSGQKLAHAVQDWARKESILINCLLNFTLPFVKRPGFSRHVSVMRLKMIYETARDQKMEEHAIDTSTMTGYDFPRADADALAIVPYEAPAGSENYGAASPLFTISDDEAPEGVLADNSAEDVFADNSAVAPGDQIVLLSDDVDNAAEDTFADNGPSHAEELLPEWDASWDATYDVVTVASVDITQGTSDSTCDGTLAAALACPGVDHKSHKALRLSRKPKAKKAAEAKAALEEIRRQKKEKAKKQRKPQKAKKQRKASPKKTPTTPMTPTTPKKKRKAACSSPASTSKRRLLFKQPVDVADSGLHWAGTPPDWDCVTIAEELIARGDVQAEGHKSGLHFASERGKVVSMQQRNKWIHQIRIGQGARREVMQVTEHKFGRDAKKMAETLLALHVRGVSFTELRELKEKWGANIYTFRSHLVFRSGSSGRGH